MPSAARIRDNSTPLRTAESYAVGLAVLRLSPTRCSLNMKLEVEARRGHDYLHMLALLC